MAVLERVGEEICRMTQRLLRLQHEDGTWRLCFENGVSLDAYMIVLLRSLQVADEPLIRRLHDPILTTQRADGAWELYADEREGNLSSTVEAYFALLYSGYSRNTDERMRKARQYIRSRGGMRHMKGLLTKVMLAIAGQYPWPTRMTIPLEFLLLPTSSPIGFFDFSGYARVHFAPVLVLADRRYAATNADTPDISGLLGEAGPVRPDWGADKLLQAVQSGLGQLAGIPKQVHELAARRAERFMLERIEPDGTLYSYASSTILMIFALLALGYGKRHPVIVRAVQGLYGMFYQHEGKLLLQNSPSTVWDTALISQSLIKAGIGPDSPALRKSAAYLLARQQHKPGDWSLGAHHPVPGGWGFSDSNTLNPDVDDTTAALRVIRVMAADRLRYLEAADKGLNWTLAMQNDDGGWPAFERNKNNELLAWLPIDGARTAALDPSSADLTGRTLEYLGGTEKFTLRHAFIRRAANWLIDHQEEDGSWYGRWGICYLYGTWAALTGLMAVGAAADHPSVRRAAEWLLHMQNRDGGWGESCRSDQLMKYVPLGASTPSQTAWALDALIAVHPQPIPAIDRGISRLIGLLHTDDWTTSYPMGSGLPGTYYTHYHSYRYIWPLLALSHYREKYGSSPSE